MRTTGRRRPGLARALLLGLGTIGLGACGDDGGAAAPMTVLGTEMSFEAPSHATPGRYDVLFRNTGAMYHELAFKSPDGDFVVRRSIAGGQQITMPVKLTTGTWELACYEPGHYEAGMHSTLVVESP